MKEWSSSVLKFDPKVIDESNRIIEGIATAPVYDRVNELITADAIRKALPDYLVLPAITFAHKDYVVGLTKEARILDDGSLFVKAQIKPTKDCDAIWELIKTGEINSFSISGSRTETTCSRTAVGSPCVTSGIYLSTITLCGNDNCNPRAAITHVYKMIFEEDNMAEEKIETTAVPDAVEKTVETPVVNNNEAVLSAISELAKTIESMKVTKEEQVIENPFEKTIGELTESINVLTKKFETMEERLTTLEETKVEKGGIIVTDAGEIKPVGNIKLENYALNRFKRD